MTETSSAQPSLSTMRLAELHSLAGSMGLKGISRMRKSELVAALSRFGALGSLAPPAASGTLLILTGAVTRVVTGGAGPIRQVDAQVEGWCGLALLGSAGGRGSPTTARAP